MSESEKKKKIISVVLLVAWIFFIWQNSMRPASVSGEQSGRILETLLHIPFLSPWLTDHIVRKAAHFTEYAIEGFLAVWCHRQFVEKLSKKGSRLLLTGVLTAFIDETIQLFVEGRSGEVGDMWIDLSGFVCGALVVNCCFLLYAKIKRKEVLHK